MTFFPWKARTFGGRIIRVNYIQGKVQIPPGVYIRASGGVDNVSYVFVTENTAGKIDMRKYLPGAWTLMRVELDGVFILLECHPTRWDVITHLMAGVPSPLKPSLFTALMSPLWLRRLLKPEGIALGVAPDADNPGFERGEEMSSAIRKAILHLTASSDEGDTLPVPED